MPDYRDEFLPETPEWVKKRAASQEENPTSPHSHPQSGSAQEGADTVYSTGHIHEWIESDEGRDDGMLTAICPHCGSGMHYHAHVHGVENGKFVNR
jgi:hypothetical protein